MPRYVNDEILDKTNCPFSFQCLDEKNIDICPVDRCLPGNFCFLNKQNKSIAHIGYHLEMLMYAFAL